MSDIADQYEMIRLQKRIEALEAGLRVVERVANMREVRIAALEAALREIAELSIKHGVAVYIARAALAEGQDT